MRIGRKCIYEALSSVPETIMISIIDGFWVKVIGNSWCIHYLLPWNKLSQCLIRQHTFVVKFLKVRNTGAV